MKLLKIPLSLDLSVSMEMMKIDDIVENTVLSSVSVFGSGLYDISSDTRSLFASLVPDFGGGRAC